MFLARRAHIKNNNSMTPPPRPSRSLLRGRSLQIYEEITNTMYNERRLELLEGTSADVLLGSSSQSAIKQRGQGWEPIASIGTFATTSLLSVAHHQV